MAKAHYVLNDPRVSTRSSQSDAVVSIAKQSAQVDRHHHRPNQKPRARASRYWTLLIVSTSLIAVGWALLRLIVLVVTLD